MAADATGWMPGVAKVPTQQWGGYGMAEDGMYPQSVVAHVAQGYFSGLLNIARSSEPGKSWHFSVGRDGEIAQHVSIWDPAYHAGVVNSPQPMAAKLIAQYGQNPNTWSVGIEQEGFSVDPGYGFDYLYDAAHPWPDAQRESVIRIHRWVWDSCQWLKDLPPAATVARLLTHSMIDQRTRRQDPGDLWLATSYGAICAAMTAPPALAPVETRPVAVLDIDGARADMRSALKKLGS
jgi:N-acetyl-anhydromuramyl-L-alanine amidase AmpD